MNNIAVILASGLGSRFNSSLPKQFTKLKDKTVLDYSLKTFNENNNINGILLVLPPNYMNYSEYYSKQYKKIFDVISGGETRRLSSKYAINALSSLNPDNVLIHDAARPFVSDKIINDCISALKNYKAVNTAIKVTDTIFNKTDDNIINSVLNRNTLMAAQTPQCFNYELIKKAHEMADEKTEFTDDCSLILHNNLAQVKIIEGSIYNFKITQNTDINYAEFLLKENLVEF